jgi:hypothetical protein
LPWKPALAIGAQEITGYTGVVAEVAAGIASNRGRDKKTGNTPAT